MTSPVEGIVNASRAPGEMTVDLAAIIVQAIEGRLAELHVGLPAKVVSFDPATQSVSVQPLLVRVLIDEDESPVALPIPVISNVPVLYAAGGGWSITYPLNPDDIVYLTFAERSIDEWLDAVSGKLVTPAQTRKHDLSDAVAIPGIRPRTAPIPNIDTANLRIAHDSGTVVIELSPTTATIKAPNVHLDSGGTADQAIPRGDALIAAIQALTVPTALGPSGVPINAAAFPDTLSGTAKVK